MNKKNFLQNWGKTQFEITGLNFDKLLNEIVFKNIKISKIKKFEKTLFLEVKNCYCSYLIDLLNQRCYNFSVKKQTGFSAVLNFCFLRWGLLIGAGLSMLLVAFLSCFIFDVVVENDSANLQAEIKEVLVQNDLAIGKFRPLQNAEKIEQCLLNNIRGISLVSASFRGTNLFVSYTLKTDMKEILQNTQNQNIVAKNDGVITHISVVSGTAVVSVGQAVKKGQILIAGYKLVDEQKVDCVATGTVFANVFKSATVCFSEKQIVPQRTGKVMQIHKLCLFNETIFEDKGEISFEKFETEECVQKVSNIIPLLLKTTKVYELQEIEILQNFDEQKQSLISQARLLAFEKIDGTEEILEEKFDTNQVDSNWFVTYTIKIKEKIS